MFIWIDSIELVMFFSVFMLMIFKFLILSSRFLVMLLTMEILALCMLILISKVSVMWGPVMVLTFFTMAVSEACLGLSLLISNARSVGSDTLPILHFKLNQTIGLQSRIYLSN